jgi:triphosphoribosyl-dephospho-CoA synthase
MTSGRERGTLRPHPMSETVQPMTPHIQPPEALTVIESAVETLLAPCDPGEPLTTSLAAGLTREAAPAAAAGFVPDLAGHGASELELGRQRIQQAFRWACGLDVAVRKPGNVSMASAGHGMSAGQFLDSAAAAVWPLTSPGASVGARIEGAVTASWTAAGCNTNLGIVLLCAPLAAAAEVLVRTGQVDASWPGAIGAEPTPPDTGDGMPRQPLDLPGRIRRLQQALQTVLAGLDVEDASAAFRAITRANPGGLGDDPRQDVRQAPRITLRAAMSLAAPRDRIARQYHDDYTELFELGLPVFQRSLGAEQVWPHVLPAGLPTLSPALENAVQRCYLLWLASGLDSHLVRKFGTDVAHSVTVQARGWRMRLPEPLHGPEPREWARWDDLLKSRRLNPGTSADLTVATAFLAGLISLL